MEEYSQVQLSSCTKRLPLLLEKEDSLHLKVEAEIDSFVHIVLIFLGQKILKSWSHKAFHQNSRKLLKSSSVWQGNVLCKQALEGHPVEILEVQLQYKSILSFFFVYRKIRSSGVRLSQTISIASHSQSERLLYLQHT